MVTSLTPTSYGDMVNLSCCHPECGEAAGARPPRGRRPPWQRPHLWLASGVLRPWGCGLVLPVTMVMGQASHTACSPALFFCSVSPALCPALPPAEAGGLGLTRVPCPHPSRPEGLRRLVKLGSQGRRPPWDGRLRASVRFASLWILSFVLLSPQVGFEVHTLMPEQGTERAHGRSCFFIVTGPTALLCTGSEPAPQAPSCRPELKLARQL